LSGLPSDRATPRVRKETEQSKIFDNAAFGYWKVAVERPLRLRVEMSGEARKRFRLACEEAKDLPLAGFIDALAELQNIGAHDDYNAFVEIVRAMPAAKILN
jgi:type I restriction enzyme M protein